MRIFTSIILCFLLNSFSYATADLSQGNAPVVSVTVESIGIVSCYGASDGYIEISVDGGTLPLSYAWSNGESTKNIQALDGGTYKVTVTDAIGASVVSQNIDVAHPEAPISVSLNFVQSLSCPDSDDGSIEVTVFGGTAPYTYLWSNGSTDEDPIGLAAGGYKFTLTDANGCLWPSPTISVNAPNPVEFEEIVMGSNAGASDGSIYVDVNGGLPPYQFVWSNGENTPTLANIPAGTYCLTVTDAYSCSKTECYEVSSITANEEIEGIQNLSLSPNPASNYAVLDLELTAPQQVQIEVIDLSGRQLFQEDSGQVSRAQISIDVQDYTPGLYFVNIQIGDQSMTKKLIIK